MTFEEAVEKSKEYGSEIVFIPMARWVQLSGPFTPEMLRSIAEEVERRDGDKKRPNNKLGSKP